MNAALLILLAVGLADDETPAPVRVGSKVFTESSGIDAGEGASQCRTTGDRSAIAVPRNRIAPTLGIGCTPMTDGTNPSPVKRRTTRESSERGTGRKKPVSVLVTMSIESVRRSYR